VRDHIDGAHGIGFRLQHLECRLTGGFDRRIIEAECARPTSPQVSCWA
jgi:hypothetical protein